MGWLSDIGSFVGNIGNDIGKGVSDINRQVMDVGKDIGSFAGNALSNPYVDAGLAVGGGLLLGPEIGALGSSLFSGGADAVGAAGDLSDFADAATGADLTGAAMTPEAAAANAAAAATTATAPTDALPWLSTGTDATGGAGSFAAGNPTAQGIANAGSVGSGTGGVGTNVLGAGGTDTISPSLASAAGQAAAPGAAPAAPNSFGQFYDQFSTANGGLNATNAGNLGNIIKSNPGTILSGGGLVMDAMKQGELAKGQRQQQDIASNMQGQGAQLESYLANGTLPPGVQQSINAQVQSQQAQIRSKYAAMGMSGSSAEQQDLANAQSQGQAQGLQVAMGLLNTGISETGAAAGQYNAIVNQSLQEDQALQSAFANFGQAASGQGGGGLSAAQLMKALEGNKTTGVNP